MPDGSIYERDLDRTAANYTPLSPVSFLRRAATVHPERPAVVHGDRSYSYRDFHERACRLASALAGRGVRAGDTVAIMAANVPSMLEAHYGVPMVGAVLNPLNTRLDAATIAFTLRHGEARIVLTDREYSATMSDALDRLEQSGAPKPLVVDVDDDLADGGEMIGELDYQALLAEGDPGFRTDQPRDEWQAICLLYTSGTTGDPKGAVYHHRGAYLNAIGNTLTFGLSRDSVYLWTLPMFHCSGWTFTWAVTAAGGTHVCLRRVDPAMVYPMIAKHGVTHMCGAPVVLTMLANAPEARTRAFTHTVQIATGGAAPPSAVIEAMEGNGFRVTHLYGLTESYGPATFCDWRAEWDTLELSERSALMARQGVQYPTLEDAMVADPETLEPAPWDGTTTGELMLRGNTVMRGYLKNPSATAAAFRGGWFHTGDLGVRHPDVLEAAVVAMPHERWANGHAPSSPCETARPRRPPRSSSSAASGWRTTKRPTGSCSARCRRPPPARSRSSCSASGQRAPRTREGRRSLPLGSPASAISGPWRPRRSAPTRGGRPARPRRGTARRARTHAARPATAGR